jgi:hypothetical protein
MVFDTSVVSKNVLHYGTEGVVCIASPFAVTNWLITFLKYPGVSFPSYPGSSVGCDGNGQDKHVGRYHNSSRVRHRR